MTSHPHTEPSREGKVGHRYNSGAQAHRGGYDHRPPHHDRRENGYVPAQEGDERSSRENGYTQGQRYDAPQERGYSNNPYPNPNPTCYNCGRRGHKRNDCRDPPKPIVCHECGVAGHKRPQCPRFAKPPPRVPIERLPPSECKYTIDSDGFAQINLIF